MHTDTPSRSRVCSTLSTCLLPCATTQGRPPYFNQGVIRVMYVIASAEPPTMDEPSLFSVHLRSFIAAALVKVPPNLCLVFGSPFLCGDHAWPRAAACDGRRALSPDGQGGLNPLYRGSHSAPTPYPGAHTVPRGTLHWRCALCSHCGFLCVTVCGPGGHPLAQSGIRVCGDGRLGARPSARGTSPTAASGLIWHLPNTVLA